MIGDYACKFISKAKWPKLRQINLSKDKVHLVKNKVGNLGCEYLSKSSWL